MKQRHLSILGPTASGKSWLALELAKAIPGLELVSVDSMQVYRGMDIGTAKPTKAEQAEVKHHVIDLVDASEEFTLSQFQSAARAAIAEIEARGNTAVLVGGTGLYLQSIIDDLELPGQYPQVRAELEDNDGPEDTEAQYERLKELDPQAASLMEPTNRRRIVRALEVTLGSGRPFSSFGPGMKNFGETSFQMFGIWIPRELSALRIESRVGEMLRDGWIDEVRKLIAAGGPSKTAAQALGYPEVMQHLDGRDLNEVTDEIINRTRSFSRRQRMWFRRDPRINWLATSQDPRELLPALIRNVKDSFS